MTILTAVKREASEPSCEDHDGFDSIADGIRDDGINVDGGGGQYADFLPFCHFTLQSDTTDKRAFMNQK
eukprot:scaffold9816_cov99-Skeletonema_dohrnii-CCMP3373.AAC.14